MSPLTALWIASVTGALLFFASGFFSAEVWRRATSATEADSALVAIAAATAVASAESLRVEVAEAYSLIDDSRQEVEALRRELELELAAKTQLDGELSKVRGRVEDVTLRLSETQRSAAAVPPLRKKLAELERSQLAHREGQEVWEAKRRALERELAHAQGELERLRGRPAPPSARVQVDVATLHRPKQSGITRRLDAGERTLESRFKQHLSGLVSHEPGLIAVVSDDNGFPVAGVGSEEQQAGVSVLTSLARELSVRVNDLVDLDRIERMELSDVNGRALRVRFFDWEARPLALGCLGKRSLVPNHAEELVVATFPKLLRRAWSA